MIVFQRWPVILLFGLFLPGTGAGKPVDIYIKAPALRVDGQGWPWQDISGRE